MNTTNTSTEWDGKNTILTKEGKKIRRAIRHVGQGFDSHVMYQGKRHDIACVDDNDMPHSVWQIIDVCKTMA